MALDELAGTVLENSHTEKTHLKKQTNKNHTLKLNLPNGPQDQNDVPAGFSPMGRNTSIENVLSKAAL